MQRARRHDPYPWTWEIPLLVFVSLMLGLAVGVQVGRSLANLLAGAGWTWPVDRATFWRSLPAIAAGDAGAGLDVRTVGTVDHVGKVAELASSRLVWGCIGVVETVFLGVAGWVAIRCLRRWGPGRLRGMATSAEAEQMLGLTRLRKVGPVVRPDLYGKPAHVGAHPARRGRGPCTSRPAALPGLEPWTGLAVSSAGVTAPDPCQDDSASIPHIPRDDVGRERL